MKGNNVMKEDDEWIVYRAGYGVNCAPKRNWEVYVRDHCEPHQREALKQIIVADNLTEAQAVQFVSLTKENEE